MMTDPATTDPVNDPVINVPVRRSLIAVARSDS
jgi:hypothetical protein